MVSETNSKFLQALPVQKTKYYKSHFSISTGYEWGKGLPEDQTLRFYNEIETLFSKAGWKVQQPKFRSSCPTVQKGGSALYCHPMELSGPCERSLYQEVIDILNRAETCKFHDVFTYDQVYDITEEAYETALKTVREDIEVDLMAAFATDRRNLYYTGYFTNLEQVAYRYHVRTLDRHIDISSDDVHMKYIASVFQDLIREGKILRKEHPERGIMYRSATGSELLELARRQAKDLDTKVESAQIRAQTSPGEGRDSVPQKQPDKAHE